MKTSVWRLSDDAEERIRREVAKSWSVLRELGLFSDAVLKTEDGGHFVIHRSIMALCSRYFTALFTWRLGDDDPKQRTFTIPGVTAVVLGEIVEHAYRGEANLTVDNVADLLIGADQFNVLGLLERCRNFIRHHMDHTNVLGVWEFAKNYFCFDLESEAHMYILRNFSEVTRSSEFLEWPLEKVVHLLNWEHLNIQSEEFIWEAGLRWINYKPYSRKRCASCILRCVRLGLLDKTYFMEKVKLHPYVESNDLCKPMVVETIKFLYDLELIGQRTEEVETPFLAMPRKPSSVLFTIGGWSKTATGLIETYDSKADRWIEVEEMDPEGARAYHKLAVLGSNIYVIGGFNGSENFNSCRCFNAVTKAWTDIAPMHTKRCYVSVATLNGFIYAIGGYDGFLRLNTVERYDARRNQWDFITPMHEQRSDGSAATLGGLVYVVGGFTGTECLASCECYDPDTNQWTMIQSMSQRRSGVSAIAYHGMLYALGGFNSVSRLVSCQKYDPATDEWSHVPDMFNPRSNFAVEIIDDLLFVIGGFNGLKTICNVECYDDRTNEWLEATDMNHHRSALAACVVSGLPNTDDYVHQNRRGLIEEKRQRLLQRNAMITRLEGDDPSGALPQGVGRSRNAMNSRQL